MTTEKPKSRYKYVYAEEIKTPAGHPTQWAWVGKLHRTQFAGTSGYLTTPRCSFTDAGELLAYAGAIKLKNLFAALIHVDGLKGIISEKQYFDTRKSVEYLFVSDAIKTEEYLRFIVTKTAAAFKVLKKEILSDSRYPAAVAARQAAQYLCYLHTNATQSEISDYFDRDRVLIIRTLSIVRDRIDTEPEFAATIKRLQMIIRKKNKQLFFSKL
jgi:hypothetical protein